MKTNVSVELNDIERNQLAILFAGKQTSRKVSRKEINEFVFAMFDSMVNSFESRNDETPEQIHESYNELIKIDPEDAERLANKSASYIIGWNKVKRRFRK